jgi:hypothetical protein
MPINRRHLLGSLAAVPFCPPAVSAAEPARPPAIRWRVTHGPGWYLTRETKAQDNDAAVDFWTNPLSDVDHFGYLPPEIARGVMCYEIFDYAVGLVLGPGARFFNAALFNGRDTPRRDIFHLGRAKTLSSSLRHVIGKEGPRTAFIALDSLGPRREPGWADLLPAFRSCYDRIIGHFHLTERGLLRERESIERTFGAEYFREYFIRAAEQCDAVILTSAALAEADLRCSPSASTGELVGNLVRQLGHALLTPAALDRLAGAPGSPRKPRHFALGSLSLWTMDDYYINGRMLLDRQRDLVSGFGAPVAGEDVLLVATAADDIHSPLVDEFRLSAGNSFFTTAKHVQEFGKGTDSTLNTLRMAVLWPFALA